MRLGYACCFVHLTQVHFVYSGLCAPSAQTYYSITHHTAFLLPHPTFVYYSCQIPMSLVQTLMLLDISQVFYIYWRVISTSCARTPPPLHLTGGLCLFICGGWGCQDTKREGTTTFAYVGVHTSQRTLPRIRKNVKEVCGLSLPALRRGEGLNIAVWARGQAEAEDVRLLTMTLFPHVEVPLEQSHVVEMGR